MAEIWRHSEKMRGAPERRSHLEEALLISFDEPRMDQIISSKHCFSSLVENCNYSRSLKTTDPWVPHPKNKLVRRTAWTPGFQSSPTDS